MGGPEAAVATIRKRSGGAYQPRMAERFCAAAATILAGLDEEPTWESVLAWSRRARLQPDATTSSTAPAKRWPTSPTSSHRTCSAIRRRGRAGGRRGAALRPG